LQQFFAVRKNTLIADQLNSKRNIVKLFFPAIAFLARTVLAVLYIFYYRLFLSMEWSHTVGDGR